MPRLMPRSAVGATSIRPRLKIRNTLMVHVPIPGMPRGVADIWSSGGVGRSFASLGLAANHPARLRMVRAFALDRPALVQDCGRDAMIFEGVNGLPHMFFRP